MALLVGSLIPRRASCSKWQGVQGFFIYLLAILANAVHTESNNVTTSVEIEYTTIFIPDSTMEILVPSASIPTSSSLSLGSFSLAPSTAPYPSSPLGVSEILTTDFAAYTTSYSDLEMTSDLSAFGTLSLFPSPTPPVLSTSVLSQSSGVFQESQTSAATSSVVSSIDMLVTSSELGNPSSPTMSENLSSLMSSTEFLSPSPSSSEASLMNSALSVIRTSSVSLPTTSQAPSSASLWSSSSPPLYSPSPPLSYMPSPSSIALITATSSGATFTTTQSFSPTSIIPTPSPTMDMSSQPSATTAGPNQLSILEWFGIAVGGAAVLFILFLLFHCYQLRQRTIRRQKKEMKKEILDFSQSNRNDRITSWRNSLALDAMATHIELPQEDSMDMQAMDNFGFEEVFLGDDPKPSANNNYFLPQTNL